MFAGHAWVQSLPCPMARSGEAWHMSCLVKGYPPQSSTIAYNGLSRTIVR
jgi:hypothetical protein